MKYNKFYLILTIMLVGIIIPFGVLAEETTIPGEGTDVGDEGNTGNTGDNTPTVPDTEGGETTTPGEDTGNTDSEGTDDEGSSTPDAEGGETTTPEEGETTIPEDNKNIEEPKEEEKKESTTNKRPSYNRPTTIIDNDPKRVEISIVGKDNQLLSGIKFQIQDKNGNIFYEEETTEEIFVFEEMELGTYYLVQVNSLEGYEENPEKVEFVVSKDLEVIKVEITNKLQTKKEEPKKEKDVFAMEVPLLSSIAMFDIALAIGVIIYVKKYKGKNKNKK